MSRRERKKAQLRLALTDTAYRLFLEHGYAATTLEDISEACDVTVPTLLRYFASKEDLLFDRHPEILEGFERSIGEAARAGRTLAYFRGFLQSNIAILAQREEIVNTYKIIEGYPPLLSKFYAIIRQYEAHLERALSAERGAAAGEDLHATLTATMLVSGLLGEMLRGIARGEIARLHARCDEIIDYVAANFRRPEAPDER